MIETFVHSLHPRSLTSTTEAEFGLLQQNDADSLAVWALTGSPVLTSFEGESQQHNQHTLLIGPCSPHNAVALRKQLAWLNPRPLGLQISAGMGDRLGLATPGHLQAIRAVGGGIAPICAQQSIREMARTGRTPQQVMDDATWGIFREGYRDGVGADADHLKTPADIDVCVAAGFTFFTIDPSAYVNGHAEAASLAELQHLADALPWSSLSDSLTDLKKRYLGHTFTVEQYQLEFVETGLLRAAVKYGAALAHVAALYRHLLGCNPPNGYELEVSVDETEQPTSHAEHLYIAQELRRLGVQFVSLAPRFIGRFEKGVDYISPTGVLGGDLDQFEADFAVHAAIARVFGPYKLSLHSGSDKFGVYPIAARQTRGMVHLKTAGTSYLEALRTLATLNPQLFRNIYIFARERFETDRATYHISAELANAPLPENVPDEVLPTLLEDFDARQILHVTFGSVLRDGENQGHRRFYEPLMSLLRQHPDAYAAMLKRHFVRHLQPFVAH